MIIARTPLRVSFGGGGTDIETYYNQFGGFIVSTTIDKYFYSFLYPRTDKKIEIISTDYKESGIFGNWEDITDNEAFKLLKAALNYFKWPKDMGLKITMASEAPGGTGLGSSCAVSVGLVNILAGLLCKNLSKQEIAEAAFYIDTRIVGFPIGKQDQYASSIGGLNTYEFFSDKSVVKPLKVTEEIKNTFEKSVMLFFGGKTRSASMILTEQKEKSKSDEVTIEALNEIKENGIKMAECIENGELDDFAELLHQSWLSKKKLHKKVSDDEIDRVYQTARVNGALGGKISGAGGGGFFIIYCHEEYQSKVRRELVKLGWQEIPFSFESEGTKIILKEC